MLRFLMIGSFRWREDAYATSCYWNDVFGPTIQCDYMDDSFECLCDGLERHDIAVCTHLQHCADKQAAWGVSKARRTAMALPDTEFDGLVVTFHAHKSKEAATLAKVYLESGKNVLVVCPVGSMHNYPWEARRRDSAIFLEDIGGAPEYLDQATPQRMQRKMAANGLLLLATGPSVSDWAHYEQYGKSVENDLLLENLREQLPLHAGRTVLITSCLPKAWPCGQEFTAEYRLKNCSVEAVRLVLSASPRDDFELFSSPDVSLHLQPGESTLVSYLVHPKVAGSFSEVLFFGTRGGERLIVRGDGITIRQALLHVLRKQSPHDTQELKRLADVAVRLAAPRLEQDVAKALALLSSDPESALNRVRKIAEKLCKSVIGAGASGSLSEMSRTLKDRGLMSDRAVSYLHTIRTIANLASHDSGKELTGEDVRIVAYALALVIEEILDAGGNKP